MEELLPQVVAFNSIGWQLLVCNVFLLVFGLQKLEILCPETAGQLRSCRWKRDCYHFKSFYPQIFLTNGKITTMHPKLKETCKNAILMLNTCCCQFYPQIFHDDFQREVIRYIFS